MNKKSGKTEKRSLMNVKDLMTGEVGTCQPEDSLMAAVAVLWQKDCGVVPVVNHEKFLVGMITDRDICIALATQNRLASEVRVCEIMSRRIVKCTPDDDLKTPLKLMRKHQVKRLPVTDENGILVGLLSISDFLNFPPETKKAKKLFQKGVLRTLQTISHRPPIGETTEENEEPDENFTAAATR
jgi:CBS domain-containing protein